MSHVPRILALDVATTTGWACRVSQEANGHNSFSLGEVDIHDRPRIEKIVMLTKPELVLIEAPFKGKGGLKTFRSLAGSIRVWTDLLQEKLGLTKDNILEIPPSEWQSAMLGGGLKSPELKELSKARATAELGGDIPEHASDAYNLLKYWITTKELGARAEVFHKHQNRFATPPRPKKKPVEVGLLNVRISARGKRGTRIKIQESQWYTFLKTVKQFNRKAER